MRVGGPCSLFMFVLTPALILTFSPRRRNSNERLRNDERSRRESSRGYLLCSLRSFTVFPMLATLHD
jgi:hypothetical protein